MQSSSCQQLLLAIFAISSELLSTATVGTGLSQPVSQLEVFRVFTKSTIPTKFSRNISNGAHVYDHS